MPTPSAYENGGNGQGSDSTDSEDYLDASSVDPIGDSETDVTMTTPSASLTALKPPEPLIFDGNVSENWKKWKKKFEIYIMATECSSKSDEIKVAILLHTIGEEAYEKFETFDLTSDNRKKYNVVIAAFEAYCVPKKNESINRHVFFHRSQGESESFDIFLTDLKRLSADCEFGNLKDSLIKDRIIGGIRDNGVKSRLLREDDLTLDRCVKLCQAAELAEKQLQTLKSEPEKVNAVRFTNNKSKWHGNREKKAMSTPGQSNEYRSRYHAKKPEQPKQTEKESRDDNNCSKCRSFTNTGIP